jgi:glycosyltransferase involved in cell wall biosynthesis
MRRLIFAIPGDVSTLTGGYGYDRRIIEHLPACGIEPVHCELPGSYPFPSEADQLESISRIARDRGGDVVMIDGLAFGAMPADVVRRIGSPLVALVHHPVGLEAGLNARDAQRLIATERAALALADHVVVTSQATRATLVSDFAIAPQCISVAEPGTDRAARAKGSGSATFNIITVGALVPRKGYDMLVSALEQIRDLDWRLRIVGSHARDAGFTASLREQIEKCGLSARIELVGECNAAQLEPLYQASDIYAMSSHYEGYGMALAEALARGLAIVTTTGGAAADTAPDDAALKVPPGDPKAFADALRRLMFDAGLRRRVSDQAWRAAEHLPKWEDAARIIAAAAEKVGART